MPSHPHYRILDDLEPAEAEELLSSAPRRDLAPGEAVVHEGERNASLFLIESGSVEVVKKGAEGDQVLARMSPGNFFGELSVFDPGPASATVVATKASRVRILEGRRLDLLMRSNPVTARKLYAAVLREMGGRLRKLDQKLVERIVWVPAPEEGS
jgi:CRP-like cAMP-binding protein